MVNDDTFGSIFIGILATIVALILFFGGMCVGDSVHKSTVKERAKVMGVYDNSTVRKVICGPNECEGD